MVDCGGFELEKDFETLRWELENKHIRLDEIKKIFLTHTHKDHSMLCGKLQNITDATVYIGKGDYLRISSDYESYREWYGQIKDYLSFWGFDKDMEERFYRSFERQYFNANLNLKNTILIDSDSKVDSFILIYTPGHTSGSICVYDYEEKILFTGDTLLKKIVSVPVIEFDEDIPQGLSMLSRHIETLKRLSGVDYKYIYLGHGVPISMGIPLVDTIFKYIERRSKRVLTLIKGGANTVYKIANALYSKDILSDVVFKEAPLVYVSDLMMPLESLLTEKKIFVKNGVIY